MRFFWISAICGIMILSGCYPDHVRYKWGWATNRIQGNLVDSKGGALPKGNFIVVQEYYSQFVQFEGEPPIYTPRARLVFPEKDGSFNLSFDLQASKIELTFLAPGYVMQRFFFLRQMGVGDLNYQAVLQKTAGWQDHLFIFISPFLQQFILEDAYRMPETYQLYLGEWLEREKNKAFPGSKS